MVRVERLDPQSWVRLRALRLRALGDEPDAFGSSLERERGHGDDEWRSLMGLGPWWIAVTDRGEDVGLVAGGRHRDDDTPWVYSMWVVHAWRGRGVAEALLDAVVAWARARGAAKLGLDVADRVPRARRFYERYGFVANGTTFPMPRDPSIELVELSFALRPDV